MPGLSCNLYLNQLLELLFQLVSGIEWLLGKINYLEQCSERFTVKPAQSMSQKAILRCYTASVCHVA